MKLAEQVNEINDFFDGQEPLGQIFWWSLNGNNYSRDLLETAAKTHGLDERFLPRDRSAISAFKRAWREAARKAPEGYLLREIENAEASIYIGLVRESSDTDQKALNYNQELTIVFEKLSGCLQATDRAHEMFSRVEELYDKHKNHNTQDTRTIIQRFVKEYAVPLRDGGGVYFVPYQNQATLEAVQNVVENVGHNVFRFLPMYDCHEAQKHLTAVSEATLDHEIKVLKEEMETLLSDSKPGKRRNTALANKLEAFEKMRAKVSTFAGILSLEAETLKADLEQARWRLKAQLSGDSLQPYQPISEDENEFGSELNSGLETPEPTTEPTPEPAPAWDVDAGF